MKKCFRTISFILLLSFTFVQVPDVQAQCPMCRMSAESNLKHGGSAGKGLNTGILYMLAMPYLLVGTLGYIWWRNRKKEEDVDIDELRPSAEQMN